ncbi:MAG: glutamine-hydrolyzing carbamoyl-phosphate synthase small subunit [Ruminiclostridium sp.]|nr:glutamine-hydrolyzing carbamoyl-phosphate synthase small subunit [Ruminiclostridium sp.]
MDFTKAKKAFLVLADGTVFEGKSFGCEGTVIGEVVFTTTMVGYQETMTDPNYCGQLVAQTFPLIGNYGTNDEDYASDNSVISGYIVREYCEEPSNFRCKYTIDDFMKKHGVIGLYDIDTRRLTRIIREKGVMNGMITNEADFNKEEAMKKLAAYEIGEVVSKFSVKEKQIFKSENAKYNVALVDFGNKKSTLDALLSMGCDVTVLPYDVSADEIKALNPDGIVLSNGPGDPALNTKAIETFKALIPEKIPTFGICLGHQILALANGAKTMKLKYGHRGANQPVISLETDRTYIVSQNYGYAVDKETLPENVGKLSFINANDKTCEGISYVNAPAFSVEFHPDACSGPQDTSYLFDRFIKLMEGK